MSDVNTELQKAFANSDAQTIIQILRHVFVDADLRDKHCGFQTPLMRMCYLQVPPDVTNEIASLLLAQAPDLNVRDATGKSALVHACITNNRALVRTLAKTKCCNPNVCDADGNTALMYVCRSRSVTAVRKFISLFKSAGLNVNNRNKKGMSALSEAIVRKDREIIRVLEKYGAERTSQIDRSRSPLPTLSTRTQPPPSSTCLSPRPKLPQPVMWNQSGINADNSTKTGNSLTVMPPSPLPNRARVAAIANAADEKRDLFALSFDSDSDDDEFPAKLSLLCNSRRRSSLSMPDLRDVLDVLDNSVLANCNLAGHPDVHLEGHSRCPCRPLVFTSREDNSASPAATPSHVISEGHHNGQRRSSLSLPDLSAGLGLINGRTNIPRVVLPELSASSNESTTIERSHIGDGSRLVLPKLTPASSSFPDLHKEEYFNKVTQSAKPHGRPEITSSKYDARKLQQQRPKSYHS